MKFTYDEVIEGILHGEEGHINLAPDDAVTWMKILMKRGYAVLFTAGDLGDEIRVDWIYAGNIGSLDTACRENVVFGSPDYVEMLAQGDYEPDEEEGEL